MNDRMTAARDWAALAGSLAMVGFLTFVPQHGPVAETFRSEPARHAQAYAKPERRSSLSSEFLRRNDMSWPSRATGTADASAVR